MPEQYTIGTLAKQSGVNVETIRYYQRLAHARRLRFIKQAQTLGFSLDEVTDLLALEDGTHCREAEQLGSQKLAMVRERIGQLRRVEKMLALLVDQCHCNTGKVRCPLISALENDGQQAIALKKKLTA